MRPRLVQCRVRPRISVIFKLFFVPCALHAHKTRANAVRPYAPTIYQRRKPRQNGTFQPIENGFERSVAQNKCRFVDYKKVYLFIVPVNTPKLGNVSDGSIKSDTTQSN